ncbi:MAG: glutathione S-transferase family protein [Caulobacterales bacterium]
MALTLYGTARSRTMRVLWMATELGLDFEHVPMAIDDPALKEAAFLALNPAGAIPTIVDDGFALAESLAINLYLAKKYGSAGAAPLYPATPEAEAQVWRWSLWAQGQLEPWVQRDARLAGARAALGQHADAEIAAGLAILDRALAGPGWLVAENFTVADLNVASVLSPSRSDHLDLNPHPAVVGWLSRCRARPAAVATRRRFG